MDDARHTSSGGCRVIVGREQRASSLGVGRTGGRDKEEERRRKKKKERKIKKEKERKEEKEKEREIVFFF